jgi:DNA-binding transcriptional regulator LsrR (DeoR family)
MPEGEHHGNAKLTEEKVATIRRLYHERGWPQARIARRYGVSRSLVCKIVKNLVWVE